VSTAVENCAVGGGSEAAVSVVRVFEAIAVALAGRVPGLRATADAGHAPRPVASAATDGKRPKAKNELAVAQSDGRAGDAAWDGPASGRRLAPRRHGQNALTERRPSVVHRGCRTARLGAFS
jgi:hypothetical protein